MAGGSDQTYWILDKRQLETMVSPQRHLIVDRLAAEGPLSIKELAAQIRCQPSSLYHHMAKLADVGLVLEVGSRVVRRRREILYGTPAPRMRLLRALAGKYPELLNEIVNSLTRQMARDFSAGSSHPEKRADGDGRNYGFLRMIARPTPSQMARINACLAEISEILWDSSDENGTAISFGWVLSPID